MTLNHLLLMIPKALSIKNLIFLSLKIINIPIYVTPPIATSIIVFNIDGDKNLIDMIYTTANIIPPTIKYLINGNT